ncbi:CUB domain-containing protein [Caerostris extrusa]|uniref:CUB domain-containing protein n=1 Tax=Caerostris extrusa TaxID=172846 RepID=A0AAV4RJ68_CAEEX|nr:CUB domain-containing protein [Caerostris extrusa]
MRTLNLDQHQQILQHQNNRHQRVYLFARLPALLSQSVQLHLEHRVLRRARDEARGPGHGPEARIQTRGRRLCPDSLVILENNHRILYTCGQADDKTRIPIQSTGGHLQVTFKSNEFLPSRGFLLYYKFNGCQKTTSAIRLSRVQ